MIDDTMEWIEKHYGGVFSDVHFAGFWDKIDQNSVHLTKAELCTKVGAEYLIDDQVKHCKAVAEAGMKGLLFGKYSWNTLDEMNLNITREADGDTQQEELRVGKECGSTGRSRRVRDNEKKKKK